MASDQLFSKVYEACGNGNLQEVEEGLPSLMLLSDNTEDDLKVLVHSASTEGHAELLSYLFAAGCPLDPDHAVYAAYCAESTHYVQVLKVFIDREWNVNHDSRTFGTALYQALKNSNISLVRFLISNGADVNAECMVEVRIKTTVIGFPLGTTPLDSAARNGTPELLQLLIDHGARLENANPLHAAVSSCASSHSSFRISNLKFLLGKGMDINAIESFGEGSKFIVPHRPLGTPLHHAVRFGNVEICKFLLENGADPNKKGTHWGTPLEWAERLAPHLLSPEVEGLLVMQP
ncbi:ankyrin repeat-containing domain protein [Massariosphaeria phaeospora]|uniref:Ankyrin repeat-containing domain protein n=1 Tax=Massariosphaeria phaeospora TaxID=100035 RepID=A0A7C8I4P9_9PLEO|nr:ankyrin repeat-containing domain protein [Massariosphaeria phaeospora]